MLISTSPKRYLDHYLSYFEMFEIDGTSLIAGRTVARSGICLSLNN